jgi:hypothetical protein
MLEDVRECELRLGQRDLTPDADAWPGTEREVPVLGPTRSVTPAVRVERLGVGPHIAVAVVRVRRQEQGLAGLPGDTLACFGIL